jgi:molecular chaperone GrpE
MTGDTPVPGEDEAVPAVPAYPEAALLGLELPDDREEAVGVLLDALAIARDSADSYLEDLQREAAEFANYRKRVAREHEDTVARAAQRLVEALLPVLDSFDQACGHQPQTPGEEQLLAGMRSTYHQLMDVLAQEGLEVVPAVGEAFDPRVHEAVAGGGDGPLVVTEEWRRGYALRGRLLRAPMVMVAPHPRAEGAGDSEG